MKVITLDNIQIFINRIKSWARSKFQSVLTETQKIQFFQANSPAGEVHDGDMWYNTGDGSCYMAMQDSADPNYITWQSYGMSNDMVYEFAGSRYLYNGSELVMISEGGGDLSAYAKKPVDVIFVAYIQPETPADNSLGDLWIDDSNVLDDVGGILKMYNAGTWQPTEAEDGMIYKSEDRSEVWVVNAQNTLTKLIQAGDSGGGTPGGSAGGDLAGSYPNPTIKSSVSLSGKPTAPTPSFPTNNDQIATTSFVNTVAEETVFNMILPMTEAEIDALDWS